MRAMRFIALFALILVTARLGRTEEVRISLIIEGGGLPAYCPALEKLVAAATVGGRIRIGYLPTAGSKPEASTVQFIERMKPYGIDAKDIQKIDISVDNASVRAESPEVARQIRECTAIFFGGGDQTRITRALRRPDDSPTAALQAIYDVWKAGAIVAGTSAGAAVQSETMITVSGVPDDSIDEGLDALDFGLTKSSDEPARRGLLISRGLGFIRSGIIDQHFTQYRGRLGRLARAVTDEKIRFGFGIDEDAALIVFTDGTIEVLGPGQVTIVDSMGATSHDGPFGCTIKGVHVTSLGHADRFDTRTATATIHANKQLVLKGQESINGNFLIPDMSGRGAVPLALFGGLGNNTSRQQIGITLKYNQHYGHGFRYTFSKTDGTNYYTGAVNGVDVDAVTQVRLDIEPVSLTLHPPEKVLPSDIPSGELGRKLAAIWFRGIMVADDAGQFRPAAPMTREELANSIAQTIRLEPARVAPSQFADVPPDSLAANDILLVVTAGLMASESENFRPKDVISRQEAASIFVRLAERFLNKKLEAAAVEFNDRESIDSPYQVHVSIAHRENFLLTDDDKIRPQSHLTRAEAAAALFEVIKFPWAQK